MGLTYAAATRTVTTRPWTSGVTETDAIYSRLERRESGRRGLYRLEISSRLAHLIWFGCQVPTLARTMPMCPRRTSTFACCHFFHLHVISGRGLTTEHRSQTV